MTAKKMSLLLILFFLTSSTTFSESLTPYQFIKKIWKEQVNDSTDFSLLTVVPVETLNKISPLLKKEFKVKSDFQFDSKTDVGRVLTTLLKEKSKKSNAKNDFLVIRYSTDRHDFENYLKTYPDSKFAIEVRGRMICLKECDLLRKAEKSKKRSDYEEFAKLCAGTSVCTYDGYKEISSKNHVYASAIADWFALLDRKDKEDGIYKDFAIYLEKYGQNSIFSKEATDSMNYYKDRYDWNIAKKSDSLNAYKKYLEHHNDGNFSWHAENKVKEFEMWEKAVASDKYEDYCTYYNEYPNGKFTQETIKKLKKEEDELWNKVKKSEGRSTGTGDIFDPALVEYTMFVNKYPSGYYASEAQNKIAELRLAPYLKDTPTLGEMPKQGPYSTLGYSLICLGNVDKSAKITVSLSGPTGFSKTIAPGKYMWIKVKNGAYKILVQSSRTENWWGNANYDSGVYAGAWSTSTSINGISMISNKDEKALEKVKEEIFRKVFEETINTAKILRSE